MQDFGPTLEGRRRMLVCVYSALYAALLGVLKWMKSQRKGLTVTQRLLHDKCGVGVSKIFTSVVIVCVQLC